MEPEKVIDHDDVIKWKHFPRYWPFVRGIHRSPGTSPHKCQWSGALMFSLICAWINGWVNNREAGDLRIHRAHYNAIVMFALIWIWSFNWYHQVLLCKIHEKSIFHNHIKNLWVENTNMLTIYFSQKADPLNIAEYIPTATMWTIVVEIIILADLFIKARLTELTHGMGWRIHVIL